MPHWKKSVEFILSLLHILTGNYQDARALEEPKKTALELIPELEKEYEELMRELEQEQAEVAEIEGSDQDYLNELKATIAEQK